MTEGSKSLSICGAIGFAVCVVGLLVDPRTMLASYLAAWFAAASIPIGALGVLFTSWLVRAGWTSDLYDPLSRATLTIPVAGVLFIPILIGTHALYPWATGTVALPWFKAMYLTPWFFALRSIGYFAVWTALALWAQRSYGDQAAMQRTAALGLIVWALTASLAGVDWLESIEPEFHSSIYGLLTLGFVLVAGLAFGIVAVLQRLPRQMANTAYAGTLLSTLLLWAYLHAMQYIIIWAGNIPDEVVWYVRRSTGLWAIALWALFLGQFIVPFFALLSARVRASTRALIWIAGASLAQRYAESAILLLPPLDLTSIAIAICLPAAILATGASLLMAWSAAAPFLGRRLGGAAPAT